MAGVDDLHLGSDLQAVVGTPATLEQLSRVHSAAYLSELGAFCRSGGGDLDPDTYATPASFDAARAAVGAGLAAVDALAAAGEGVAFVAARPPGHHAPTDRAMGFCLLNNVAVTAAALVARGERVLIVDWDVHHGNGTQDVFWDDPSVLFVSTHQWPLYPGTGAATEVGGPHALGLTVNVPLAPARPVTASGPGSTNWPPRRSTLSTRPGCSSPPDSTHTEPTPWPTSHCRAATSPTWPSSSVTWRHARGASPFSSRGATTSRRCAVRSARHSGRSSGSATRSSNRPAGRGRHRWRGRSPSGLRSWRG